jgi:signal transduction histidine kinase
MRSTAHDSSSATRPPSRRRRGTGGPSKLDIGIAVAAAVLVVVGTMVAATLQDEPRPLDVGAFTLVTLAAVALAWRRRAPVAVLSVIVTLVAAYLLIGYPYGPIQLCMVVAMFEVARRRGLRSSLLACGAAIAAITAATLSRTLVQSHLSALLVPALLLVVWASWLVIPWLVGALVQVRSAAARRARQELVARAALEERMRLASEVHDVAGHGLAAVAMQAGVALLVFDEQPKQARESLEAIQSTSVQALSDLRMLLDAFDRRTGAEPGGTGAVAGQGLPDLDALVDRIRAAGLPVQLSLEDVAVPEDVGQVAYRVVQEALTNVVRHAGPTTAEVRVHHDQGTLVVEVLDGGVGAKDVRPGLGLTGMRNRVVAAGGELVARPRAGGGFRVCARLPIGGDAR